MPIGSVPVGVAGRKLRAPSLRSSKIARLPQTWAGIAKAGRRSGSRIYKAKGHVVPASKSIITRSAPVEFVRDKGYLSMHMARARRFARDAHAKNTIEIGDDWRVPQEFRSMIPRTCAVSRNSLQKSPRCRSTCLAHRVNHCQPGELPLPRRGHQSAITGFGGSGVGGGALGVTGSEVGDRSPECSATSDFRLEWMPIPPICPRLA